MTLASFWGADYARRFLCSRAMGDRHGEGDRPLEPKAPAPMTERASATSPFPDGAAKHWILWSIVWLTIVDLFGLVLATEFVTPEAFGGIPWLSFSRVRPALRERRDPRLAHDDVLRRALLHAPAARRDARDVERAARHLVRLGLEPDVPGPGSSASSPATARAASTASSSGRSTSRCS